MTDAVAADEQAVFAAGVEDPGPFGINEQGADIALDEGHAVAGAAERDGLVEAAEDSLADGPDVDAMGDHEAVSRGGCLQGRASSLGQPGGSSASSGSMQGMPSRTG